MARRYRPADGLAAHPVRRLASVMRRQQRADRLEAEVLTQLEQRHDGSYVGGYVPSSPRAWDAPRFSAVQRQRARLDRTFFQLMDELGRFAPTPEEDDEEEEWRNEPEVASPSESGGAAETPNEPKGSPPATAANDDGAQDVPKEGPPPSPRTLPPLDPVMEALLAGGDAWRPSIEGLARQFANPPKAASPAGPGQWPAAWRG